MLWLTRRKIAGFEQAIQAYAIHVLSLTYQKVPRTVLAEVCFVFVSFPFNVVHVYSKMFWLIVQEGQAPLMDDENKALLDFQDLL